MYAPGDENSNFSPLPVFAQLAKRLQSPHVLERIFEAGKDTDCSFWGCAEFSPSIGELLLHCKAGYGFEICLKVDVI